MINFRRYKTSINHKLDRTFIHVQQNSHNAFRAYFTFLLIDGIPICPELFIHAGNAIWVLVKAISVAINVVKWSSYSNEHFNIILVIIFVDLHLNFKLRFSDWVTFNGSIALNSSKIVTFTPTWKVIFFYIYEIWTFILVKFKTVWYNSKVGIY